MNGPEGKREWLVKAREAAGLTQRRMAGALGMTPSSYRFLETTSPSHLKHAQIELTVAVKIGEILHIPIEEMAREECRFRGIDPPEPSKGKRRI